MAGMRWEVLTTDANLMLMSQVLGIKEATAAVMANRGIRSKNAAIAFLRGISATSDILEMKDVKKAFDRMAKGIRNRERIMIYGDYDADGVMSTVILYKALRACGADIRYYIPHREEEGYGLNIEAVRMIRESDHDLIITTDNGISALEEIAEAAALGMDVVVIDHHEPGFVESDGVRQDVLPKAVAVVDPKQSDCPYPFKEMCAAGLAFRLAEAFYRYVGRDFSALHDELLVFAAIATVCDIVDLSGENRVLVKRGLEVLNANKSINHGLAQLIALRGYMDKPIDTFTIGFVLGPCINATGRLESAEISVKLLLEGEQGLAQQLSVLNEERKNLTRRCTDRVLQKADEQDDNILVLVDEETHESIAGIVAGKVKEALHRPVIVLTKAAEPGVLKGSGRSIPAYNMFEGLYANRDLLLRFGGHAMAAGMSLDARNVPELRERLNENCNLQESDLQGIIHIDRELSVEEISLELAKELGMLAPFGKGNREPMFMTRGMKITNLRVIKEKNTIIFTFGGLKGIAFGLDDVFSVGMVIDAVYMVESNTFNGRTSVQIRVKDYKIRE